MVEMFEKKWVFSKRRSFLTMFFSERLECSSFDKLKRNFSENSRKKFAQFSEFARIKYFVRNNPHSFPPDIWNAVLTTLLKLSRKSKNFQRKVRETMDEGFFSRKFPDNFSTGDLECSFDQFVENILSEVWEILWLSQPVYLFIYIFFDLWFNWSWKLTLKKLIWTRKM